MIESSANAPASIARRLARTPERWWPHVRRDTGRRWYVKLAEGRHFEAWLLGWPVGEGIELHDHGTASGALAVVEGCLLETYVDPSGWGRPGSRLHHRLLPEGDLVEFGPDHIHDVVNGGRRQALSIHVYSPRLRSMTFYENRPDRGLAAVRTETSSPALALV
ncbi:MAG TPA: cysteine dioxygenase family protein [Acidimicrobiia bacterium]|nr:cysteine dioxygenase family protein [Acidimicrobiia bacterium]